MADEKKEKIGLCLSGGGIRAAAFHSGVFQWLSEMGRLENIYQLSTVSGGSLFAGLLIHKSNYKWPSSKSYLDETLPAIRETLLNSDLKLASIRKLIHPRNWIKLNSRANIIADCLHDIWGIDKTLSDLPSRPIWSINGTTAESGKRFRFKDSTGGDYSTGYADLKDFPVCAALAMSAAFPGIIGPLEFEVRKYSWKSTDSTWDGPSSKATALQFETLHLYDGGVYDNLGLEPLFDMGTQTIKKSEPQVNHLIVSDAGFPLQSLSILGPMDPRRFRRLFDLVTDQSRALRVRSFVNFIKVTQGVGSYLQIGSNPSEKIEKYCLEQKKKQIALDYDWMGEKAIHEVRTFPTDLSSLSKAQLDLITRHGYETAKWNYTIF